ncbi:MAG: MFS transporter [Pseudomonadota bacterium]
MRGITKQGAIALRGEGATVDCSQAQKRIVLIVAILGSTLGFIDGTIVAIIAPAIRADLSASLTELSWVVNGYTLVLTAFILVGGSAGDALGRRKVFGLGIAIFAVASLACAIAAGAGQLIGARVVQGIGAALMVPSSLALIATYYPKEERGRAVGVWAAASGVSAAIGPLLGGLMVDVLGWRSTFYINLPLAGVTLWLLYARVPDDAHGAEAKRLDWPGACLAVVSLGLLALALTLLGESDGLSDAFNVGPVGLVTMTAAGLAFAGVFLWHEARTLEPMMPLYLFGASSFSAVNAATFLLYAALGGLLFFLPVTLLSAFDLPAVLVGALFLPFTAVMAVLTPRVGSLVDQIGVRWPLAGGSALAGIAFWLTSPAIASGSLVWVGAAMVLLGLGMALCIPPLSTAIINAVSEDHSGVASGINNAVSRAGGLFAVAAFAPLAALMYAASGDPGVPGFGVPVVGGSAVLTDAHRAASLAAYNALAIAAALLALASSLLIMIFVRSSLPDNEGAASHEKHGA